MKQHFLQIDLVKGVAIVSVLFLHALPKQELLQSYAVFHIWQAVPVFMVVMGLNLGFSGSGKLPELHTLYNRVYFQKKAARIFLPFLLMFIFSLVIGLCWILFYKTDILTFNVYSFVGVLPVSGKGNYFITLLLESIFFLPVMGYTFKRWPLLSSTVFTLLEVAFLLVSKHVILFNQDKYLYDAAFPR
jgi:hypothetical protein